MELRVYNKVMEKPHIIDTIGFQEKRVILTHEKWKQKAIQHPELNNQTFLRNLKKTIEEPSEVWEDKDDKKCKRCYYRKYSAYSYVKVVIWIKSNPCRIVSAFETNYVKETKYRDLRQIL